MNNQYNGLAWVATGFIIAFTALTAIPLHPLNIFFGLAGTFLWALVGVLRSDNALVTVNGISGGFLIASLIGHFFI